MNASRRRCRLGGILAVIFLSLTPAGCGRPSGERSGGDVAAPTSGPLNVVLVVLCSTRYDRTSLSGMHRDTTPFLAELARSGVSFNRALSASSWTKPGTASLITGTTPNVHALTGGSYSVYEIASGAVEPNRVLAEGFVTLAELLQGAGYQTAAFINNVNAGDFFGLTTGYDLAVVEHRVTTDRLMERFDGALENRDPSRPFFTLLFTLDAHIPYQPSREDYERFRRTEVTASAERFPAFREQQGLEIDAAIRKEGPISEDQKARLVDLYDAALATTDRRVSRLMEVLERHGVAQDTTIIVTADHGEHFFEPKRTGISRVGHGWGLDQPVLHVPLVIAGASVPAERHGERVSHPVSTIDLYPTIAEIAGAELPLGPQGTSLQPLIQRSGEFEPRPVFSSLGGFLHTTQDERFKLWSGDGRFELYDLDADPTERTDVKQQFPSEARRLREAMESTLELEATLRSIIGLGAERALTPEMEEKLRSLGYLQ